VVEFGLVGHRMHEVDERVWVQDIHDLKAVYARIMADFFAVLTGDKGVFRKNGGAAPVLRTPPEFFPG
jgi:hypothetical protein